MKNNILGGMGGNGMQDGWLRGAEKLPGE